MSHKKNAWSLRCSLVSVMLLFWLVTSLSAQSLTITVPDTAAPSRSLLKLPIRVSDVSGLGIVSLGLKIIFDPNVLDALGANSKGTISQAWGNPTTSDSTGQITLAMSGLTPLAGEGILTYVFFDVIGAKDDTTTIGFRLVSVNEGAVSAAVRPGKFVALEAEPAPNVKFSLPDTSGDSGSYIELPIRVSDLSPFQIDSMRIWISYNKYVIQALDVITAATLTHNWQVKVETQLPGNLSFLLKGSPALQDSGVLCRIRCELKGNPGMATPVHFQHIACYKDTMRIATQDGKVSIAGGTMAQVTVSIPDISADSGSTVIVPIFVSQLSPQDSVSAVAIAITYDPTVIAYQRYNLTNTLLDGWFCSANVVHSNLLRFGGFSASWIVGQGVLVEFVFQVLGRPAMQTALSFSEMTFNEGRPTATAFSGVFTVNYVIPVELVTFKAERARSGIVLSWITASESSNYGFEVQRSMNGATWQTIGFVPGHGTTSQPHHYTFQDGDLTLGTRGYRLKQIDYDGQFILSAPIQIVIAASERYGLEQNYPNPFNSATLIQFDLPEPAAIRLTLYDLLGKQVAVIAEGSFDAGHHFIPFRSDRLAAGMYFYKLEANHFVAVKKLLVLK